MKEEMEDEEDEEAEGEDPKMEGSCVKAGAAKGGAGAQSKGEKGKGLRRKKTFDIEAALNKAERNLSSKWSKLKDTLQDLSSAMGRTIQLKSAGAFVAEKELACLRLSWLQAVLLESPKQLETLKARCMRDCFACLVKWLMSVSLVPDSSRVLCQDCCATDHSQGYNGQIPSCFTVAC